uniref:Ymf67 n=1 Tax=Tetrahymena malaccensis TaxID=5901 RepID=Q09F91_TETMA|nr:Ymf67 [Tetrahymena malaccensis]ABI51660.1 Ymf67 [Tetrahymena malaccensis]
MTALFLHILWSISYIIISIIYNIITFLFTGIKLNQYNNNYFIKIILIIFYNKNLSFYKNLLTEHDINNIELSRFKNYPTLVLIHSNINKLEKKTKINTSFVNFKTQYKLYKFLNENLNLNVLIENCNNKIIFSTINYIININYNSFFKIFKTTDILTYLFINRLAIVNEKIIVNKYNISKFNDYIKYINSIDNNEILLDKQIILGLNQTNNLSIKSQLNNKLLNSYKKLSSITITNNSFFLKNLNNNYNTLINNDFLQNLKNTFKISFSASNIVKYLSDKSVNNSVILYLRKNKVFNKSRYSRNRQTYRTGAYWCLYVNIVAVVAFYFWFYKFTMNFGYLWWLLYSLILSFFFSRALKHRFYNPLNILNEYINGFKWFILIISNIIKPLTIIIKTNYNNLFNYTIIKYNQSFVCNLLIKNKSLEFNYILSSFNLVKDFNNLLLYLSSKLF